MPSLGLADAKAAREKPGDTGCCGFADDFLGLLLKPDVTALVDAARLRVATKDRVR